MFEGLKARLDAGLRVAYAFIFIGFDSFVDDARPAPTATAL